METFDLPASLANYRLDERLLILDVRPHDLVTIHLVSTSNAALSSRLQGSDTGPYLCILMESESHMQFSDVTGSEFQIRFGSE
jgi:hypothetical protein